MSPPGPVDPTRPAGPTYPEVGGTGGPLPPGYHHLHRSVPVGSGADTFRRAASDLFTWQVQRRAGLVVEADGPVRLGRDAALILALGPFRLRAPVRVVAVTDEPGRAGFAYGTLPGHPERGEESFLVEHEPDDSVHLVITAFSRPATLLARLGGPVARRIQTMITERYLRALTG